MNSVKTLDRSTRRVLDFQTFQHLKEKIREERNEEVKPGEEATNRVNP